MQEQKFPSLARSLARSFTRWLRLASPHLIHTHTHTHSSRSIQFSPSIRTFALHASLCSSVQRFGSYIWLSVSCPFHYLFGAFGAEGLVLLYSITSRVYYMQRLGLDPGYGPPHGGFSYDQVDSTPCDSSELISYHDMISSGALGTLPSLFDCVNPGLYIHAQAMQCHLRGFSFISYLLQAEESYVVHQLSVLVVVYPQTRITDPFYLLHTWVHWSFIQSSKGHPSYLLILRPIKQTNLG